MRIIICLIIAGILTYLFDRYKNRKYSQPHTKSSDSDSDSDWDTLFLISFLFPIIGFIIAIWTSLGRSDKKKAKSYVKYALYGVLTNLVLGIITGRL